MRSRVWTCLLVTVFFLAGCTAPTADESDRSGDPGVVTDPSDYSYLQGDAGAHIHDYWDGADEKEVLWYTNGYTYNNVGGTSSTWSSAFFPPDGAVVPQGTSHLSIRVAWAGTLPAGNSYGDMSLWAKAANATEARLVAGQLENNGTVTVPLTYNESDLPHQLISAWEFQVRIHGSSDPYNAFLGTITMEVTAHRGLELLPFPAHPDHWGDRIQIPLAEEEGTFQQITYTGSGGFNPRIGPLEGALVPTGASHVEVVLEAANGWPVGDVRLQYHGADSRSWTDAPTPIQSGTTRTYNIPIGPGMNDGPYAEASLWEFLIRTSGEPGQSIYNGEYRLTATVHKA